MLQTTVEIIRSALKADESVTPADRTRIIAILKNGEAKTPEPPAELSQPRIIRRAEAAKLLGRSLRTIDLMAQSGLLKRKTWRGRDRAAGFTSESVRSLIEAGR